MRCVGWVGYCTVRAVCCFSQIMCFFGALAYVLIKSEKCEDDVSGGVKSTARAHVHIINKMMKQGVRNLLLKVLDENIHVCCLCLKTVENNRLTFENEVVDADNNILKFREVLSYVFGEMIITQLADIGSLCSVCSAKLMDSFQFIKESKRNAEYIHNVLEHLETLFDNVQEENLDDCNTLFLSLEVDPVLRSCQMYDTLDVSSNVTKAFQRYQNIISINEANIKIERNEHKNNVIPRHQDATKSNIQPKEIKTETGNVKIEDENHKLKYSIVQRNIPIAFQCPECSECFSSLIGLRKHRKVLHPKFIGTELGKRLNTLRMHEQLSKHICPDCGRVYKNRTTLRLHYDNNICQQASRNSPANAKYTCDYCNKKYTQKMTLRVHIQHEHLNYKNYECEWCKKKFWCQSRLKAHIVKHTKEKNFLCEICNKKFVTKVSLLYHTRIHTGEKPYECPQCDSRFLSASRRKAHIKSQHEDASSHCNNCHSSFKSHHYLFKHRRTCMHRGDSSPKPLKSLTLSDNNVESSADNDEFDVDLFKMPPKKMFKTINFEYKPSKVDQQDVVAVHVEIPLLSQETVQFVEQERNEMVQLSGDANNEARLMYQVGDGKYEEEVVLHVSETYAPV